jgi:hypothetical protein
MTKSFWLTEQLLAAETLSFTRLLSAFSESVPTPQKTSKVSRSVGRIRTKLTGAANLTFLLCQDALQRDINKDLLRKEREGERERDSDNYLKMVGNAIYFSL